MSMKKRIISSLLILLTCFLYCSDGEVEQLTLCGPSPAETPKRSLVFVSTLDGKISALNAAQEGAKQWTLDFDKGPMLSSNIHRRELNNNGQWVRLIPSLKGGLFKFDGENLEAVPISSEYLLQSSFRYTDDLVFSGGKEKHSYGVSSRTGQILYECNISGCTNNTDGDSYVQQEVLIIQRYQHTIRAVEPRTGVERWNFSVGQHDLTLISGSNVGCHDQSDDKNGKSLLDVELKVIIPEGLIWAVSKSNPDLKLWQYKFDSPIVTVWREHITQDAQGNAKLKEINLFDGTQWTWGSEFTNSPSVYLGMHEKQLYIQENKAFRKMLDDTSETTINSNQKFPWQPYPAISTAVATSIKHSVNGESENETSFELSEVQSTTALSVLYNSEYINGNGFYLYSKSHLNGSRQCQGKSNSGFAVIEEITEPSLTDYINEDGETPVQVIIVSLWYWWKEVVIISFTTAILLNFMLTQRLLNASTAAKEAVAPPLIVERHYDPKEEDRKNVHENGNGSEFTSRYLTDFEPIDCLGKGGYGVVFEAKNKIDECNYAIKRIALPNSQDSRGRVMREVKALAKLDHHNIVRYFNAWLECPPPGWQEEHDQLWIDKLQFSSSEFPSEVSRSTKPSYSVCIDVPQSEQSSVDSAVEACELNQLNVNDDSFIVFDDSDNDENETETENVIVHGDTSSTCSTSATGEQVSRKDKSDSSESIIFQTSAVRPKDLDTTSRDRKVSLSLDLKKQSSARRSTKMFLYIQMQLCQRLSLREWLKRETLPRDSQRIVNIFIQIVDAVEYVHLQGLIHRDLKPSNIFFAYDEKIKIGDFGLVTAMTEGYDEARTPTDQKNSTNSKINFHTARVGTHLYMSPEQMNGQGYNYKVDIYSLGIIFFELLRPFSTEMERIMALTNLRKSIFPEGFAEVYPAEFNLLKMMLDKDPNKRPTTLGIKARPPLLNSETFGALGVNEETKWHFELPPLSRHSSMTSSNSSSGESWENVH